MPHRGRALLCAAVLFAGVPGIGHAQVFLASQAHPQFAIGPLFLVAGVRPDLGPVTITISWSLTPASDQRAADIEQDLFLLWPHELVESTAPGPADPALVRELEERGFVVSGSGGLALGTRDHMQMGTGAPVTPLPAVASFVSFARSVGPAAQLGSATYIKIPWTPKLADRRAVAVLTFASRAPCTTGKKSSTSWRSSWTATGSARCSPVSAASVRRAESRAAPHRAGAAIRSRSRSRSRATTWGGAVSGEPARNGGWGSYSIPSWIDCATSSPAMRAASVSAMSIPDDTPAAVTTLPCTTTRFSVGRAPKAAS